MLRFVFVLILAPFMYSAYAQSVKDYIDKCSIAMLNSRFDSSNSALIPIDNKYSYRRSYLFPCTKIGTLYNLPIVKSIFEVTERDTIDAIEIFLPFDKAVVKRLESDLGPSEPTWTAVAHGTIIDTANFIPNKRWYIDKYVVSFRCTRYNLVLGESSGDYMIFSIYPRRDKRE